MANKVNIPFLVSIVLLVLMVSLVALIGNPSLTGHASRTTGSCSDSDGGKNRYEKGVVTIEERDGQKSYEDYCISQDRVLEYHCTTPTRMRGISELCIRGCTDGACPPY